MLKRWINVFRDIWRCLIRLLFVNKMLNYINKVEIWEIVNFIFFVLWKGDESKILLFKLWKCVN